MTDQEVPGLNLPLACLLVLLAVAIIYAAWFVLKRLSERTPFGLAPFIILCMAVTSGGWLLFHPIKKSAADLTLWCFAYIHTNVYVKAVHPLAANEPPRAGGLSFEERNPGTKVDVQLVHNTVINNRLRAAMQAGLDVPDLVEVEITQAGSFFRGPAEQIGFRDLTPFLERERDVFLNPANYVTSRYAPYTHKAKVYGLPHDVHPVMLAYRRDLFEKYGLDPEKLTTWEEFIQAGRRITKPGERYMLMLPEAEFWGVQTVLLQRGGGYFDAQGQVTLDSDLAADTLQWYVRLLVGPGRIAGDPGFWTSSFYQALNEGYVLSYICPDWRCSMTEQNVKHMDKIPGNMALMPLPAFEKGGRRTSTWGGTMLGITTKCAEPEKAWALARHLYTDPETLALIFRETNIIPPLRTRWKDPVFAEPRAFWSGQKLGQLFMALAPDVPRVYPSPFLTLAAEKLQEALAASLSYYRDHGEEGFGEFVRQRLKADAGYVRKQMERNPF